MTSVAWRRRRRIKSGKAVQHGIRVDVIQIHEDDKRQPFVEEAGEYRANSGSSTRVKNHSTAANGTKLPAQSVRMLGSII